MARNQIKGITVKIGGDTTELGKALESVNKKSDALSDELREINRQLKFDPQNTELLAQKQKVLASAVDSAAEKLKKLKEAERQVQEQFERGDATEEQVRALRREIIATENKMESYKSAAKASADATENLGESAEKASDDFTVLKGAVANFMADAAMKLLTALVELPQASREYRTEMGKLGTAFESAGHTQEAATETYEELQSILGDTGQAVEAANHLAQLTDNEKDLATWTNIAAGVYATFGASLPIENITEAANETAKTGKITGGFADAINWAKSSAEQWKTALGGNKKALEAFEAATKEGMSAEDAFNEALAACTTEQERQTLITSTLNTLYGEAATKYKETNAEVIAANEANEKWAASTAEVGAAIEPLLTKIIELGANLLNNVAPVISAIVNNLPIVAVGVIGVTAALIAFKVASIAATAATQGMTLAQYAAAAAQGVLNAVMSANPIGLIILGITALIMAVMAMVKHWDEFSAFFIKLWEGIKKVFTSVVDWIKARWQELLPKIEADLSRFVEGLKALPGKIWSAITGAIAKVGEWGTQMAQKAKTSMQSLITSAVNTLKELPGKVVSIGGDLVSGLWNGVKDKLSWMKKKLSSFATSVLDSIKDFFGVHSPSTETEWLGKMLDEGMAVGVEKNANEPIKAMDRLSSQMLTAASGEGDLTLERRISHTFNAGTTTSATDNIGAKLDLIYKAVKAGQIIMLDGKTLVGSTADRYDSELGQRRVLAERGAL